MTQRPNILIITTHDTGRHFHCYGVDTVHTPCVDQLAGEGVKLTQMHATVPICCASRASMMTGRYPQSHGLMDLCFPPFNWKLHDDEQHLSQLMRDAGYDTHLFGMQHETQDITRLGFDHVHHARPLPPCDAIAEAVASFLSGRGRNDKPFYAQIGLFETHSPFDRGGVEPDDSLGVHVPPYLVASEPLLQQLRLFQGMIRKMDAAVGAIMDALSQHGLADDTLVVFTTDHGIEFPRAKWNLYDPGIETAMIVRWPGGGIAGGRVCDQLLGNIDLLPTLLQLISVDVPANVQGRSFAEALVNPDAPQVNDHIFAMFAKRCQGRAIRTCTHKLIRNYDTDRWHWKPVDMTNPAVYGVSPAVELYDLTTDPYEFKNLAADPAHATIRRELEGHLYRWLEAVNDPILHGPLRTPTYDERIADYHAWRMSQ